MKRLCIVGGRPDGSSKVVLDIALLNASVEVAGFFDDDRSLWGSTIEGIQVVGGVDLLAGDGYKKSCFALAFADPIQKEKVFEKLVSWGLEPLNLIHPSAVVARNTKVGRSVWMAANVAVNSGTTIGDGVVLNTGCTVDHDCVIESYANISPGCHVSGRTRIGQYSFLGTGAVTIPDVTVGKRCIVGAGTVVLNNVPDSSTIVGVPGRVIKKVS